MGRGPKPTLLQRQQMGKRHIKRCSISLIIREMQIKSTMRYHLTSVRMTITKSSTKNKSWTGYGEKRTFLCCWSGSTLLQSLQTTVWRFLKNLKIELPYNSAIPLLGIYPEKNMICKDICTTMFIASLITIAKTQKQPKCLLTEEWIKKMWYVNTMGYFSAIKK